MNGLIMKFLVVTICFLQVLVCYTKCDNITTNATVPEVKLKYPYHAIIKIAGSKFLVCEGVLIEKKIILTTPECVDKYKNDPKYLEIIMGAISTENLDSDPNIQIRSVSNIEISPQWNVSEQKLHGLALIQVKIPFNLNDHVATACYDKETVENKIYNLIGYGSKENLNAKPLIVSPKAECDKYVHSVVSSSGLFCMKSEGKMYLYISDLHAGAPIGDKDDTKCINGIWSTNYRGTFASTFYHKDWIKSTVAKLGPQGKSATSTDTSTTSSN